MDDWEDGWRIRALLGFQRLMWLLFWTLLVALIVVLVVVIPKVDELFSQF